MMKKRRAILTLAMLAASLGGAFAEIDIVLNSPDEQVYVLKNTATGRVFGTFWDGDNDTSDYGFESSIAPEFSWSSDRRYVAVTAGEARSRTVSLYEFTGRSLKEIPVPQLSPGQSAQLDAVEDPVADGMEAVRWQPDGTLLLKFWVAKRVTSEDENDNVVSVWADLEIQGNSARIVGTSSVEPVTPPSDMFPNPAPPGDESSAVESGYGMDENGLVGTHRVTGTNPDGSTYEGTVEIKVIDGVVGLKWKVGKTESHGFGTLVGMTLGVALENGLAVYNVFGQSEGLSLIGLWTAGDSSRANHEAIVIGNADMTSADIEPGKFNGRYTSIREVEDGQLEGSVIISGGDNIKSVTWKTGGRSAKYQGLAVGHGIGILTSSGLSVLEKQEDSLEGFFVTGDGVLQSESLIPAE